MSRVSLFHPGLAFLLSSLLWAGCSSNTDEGIPTHTQSETENTEAEEAEKAPVNEFQLSVQNEPWGETPEGRGVNRYILTNENGVNVSIITYGATVTSLSVPDRDGKFDNVTLEFDNLEGYFNNSPYFGGICGRYAGRIANGRFSIDGKEYTLATNAAPHHLHGGKEGFNKKVWRAQPVENPDSVEVELVYVSPDGEEGYPGNLKTNVIYTLTNDNELKIEYEATSDKATVLNLTNHCYWNLAGTGSGDVLNHQLMLNCDQYIPVDKTTIPTGESADVAETPMDFTQPKKIGKDIDQVGNGYDHCYVINRKDSELALAARLKDPGSGRVMEVYTTEPGVQLYTGNYLDGSEESGGFKKHEGVCLECQHFPDSPNHPGYPKTVLTPGEVYRQTTVHKFSVEGTSGNVSE